MPGKSQRFNDWQVIGFKGYLDDGSVLSTRELALERWPKSGYIALNAYFDQTYAAGSGHPEGTVFRYKDTFAGDNFYCINPQNWREYDGVQRLNQAPPGAIVFEGVEVEKADFLRIYNAAYGDREF